MRELLIRECAVVAHIFVEMESAKDNPEALAELSRELNRICAEFLALRG